MKQIVQSARSGKFRLAEVPEPRARAGHLLVATRASLISAGTERDYLAPWPAEVLPGVGPQVNAQIGRASCRERVSTIV